MGAALSGSELAFLAGATFLAGLVRGFSGFGTGMIYLPAAATVLPPFAALTTIAIFDLAGPLPNVPRALRDGAPRDVLRLALGLALTLPFALWLLTLAPPEAFRFAVSLMALGLLGGLLGGLRYRGALSPPLIYATGGLAGLTQGLTGLPGPPVILLYMASDAAPRVIRANTLLFLLLAGVAMLPVLALYGRLEPTAILLGAALIVPNLAGNMVGARLFRPERERLFRSVAYGVIAVSALIGLPIWG